MEIVVLSFRKGELPAVLGLFLGMKSRVTVTERDFINKADSCAQAAAREGFLWRRRVIKFRVGEPEAQETAQCDFQDSHPSSLLLSAGPQPGPVTVCLARSSSCSALSILALHPFPPSLQCHRRRNRSPSSCCFYHPCPKEPAPRIWSEPLQCLFSLIIYHAFPPQRNLLNPCLTSPSLGCWTQLSLEKAVQKERV